MKRETRGRLELVRMYKVFDFVAQGMFEPSDGRQTVGRKANSYKSRKCPTPLTAVVCKAYHL